MTNRYALLAIELAVFSGFTWALIKWFRETNVIQRWELWFIKIAALIFLIAHLSVAVFYPLPETVLLFTGISLLLIGGILFWWTVSVFKDKPPTVAFSGTIGTELKTKGPYGIVRNPFYTSYSMAWIGGTIATGCWWLIISFFCMFFIYWRAAKFEEQQWLNSKDASNYFTYMQTTGMFLPKLIF